MDFPEEMKVARNGAFGSSNGIHDRSVEENEKIEDFDADNLPSLVEWLNHMDPHLNLPLEASEEELRACLIDGNVLCSILHKLNPGSVDMRGNSEPGPEKIKRFLAAMDEMGLPRFVLADLQQGYMVPVLQCLGTLRAHFHSISGKQSTHNHSRKLWNLLLANSKGMHKQSSAELLHHAGRDELMKGFYGDLSDSDILELTKLNGLDNVPSRMLFSLMNKILDASIERKNGFGQHMALLVKKVLQVIEQRFSSQAENLKDQNKIYNVRTEKSQSKIRALEALASGTTEEIEVVFTQLQQIKMQKNKIEEKEKLEELDLARLKEEKNNWDSEKLKLNQELELAKKTYEEHCLLLEAEAKETKTEFENRIKELELLLVDSRSKVKELESFTESKSKRWRKKEGSYRRFIDSQSRALKELRVASNSMKREVLKEKRNFFEEFQFLGVKLKGLADAAENYHSVLAENRRLYNEVQDLKGNIRVYCRIRPFLPGQSKKQTTIEYIGENGELIVSNPLKQGKDNRRIFKFNKVFGPAAGQEEVFLDIQPLIRSVLDGYNVCIFAYGQTGSGKTYTMSGPTLTSKDDWGVNYRALHDLFQISENRKNSIQYEVGVQMVEIYNEQVRDLLSSEGPHKRLGIWNITQPNGLAVPDASMQPVKSTSDVLELMSIGLMNRAVGATALNERSSRSHSVLTVHVRGVDLESGAVLRGNLHLIDLAGSERVERTEATGDRLREAQHINKSLSALGDVIFALAQKSPHVPYRNSKLTQVLQSSLGGQAKTLMFVQLNPDVDSYSETISTLKFAERVSGIELGAAKSSKEGRDVRELMQQVASLKDTITKKDEEIERLHRLKTNSNGMRSGANSLRSDSNSPKRHSVGSPLQVSKTTTGGKGLGPLGKGASDTENSSDFSEKRSEAGSTQSMDELRYQKGFMPHSKSSGDLELKSSRLPQTTVKRGGQNFKEDNDILGFEDGDSDERLSDISDGGLSMGTETESVEFSLFPDAAKSSEAVRTVEAPESVNSQEIARPIEVPNPAQKPENPDKANFTSKLPRPPKRVLQTTERRLTQFSITKGSASPRASLSVPRKNAHASSSGKRWQ